VPGRILKESTATSALLNHLFHQSSLVLGQSPPDRRKKNFSEDRQQQRSRVDSSSGFIIQSLLSATVKRLLHCQSE
jgi:hypothetical protein